MMIYKNSKTGAVIETDSLISGGDWVQEKTKKPAAKPDTGAEKTADADAPGKKEEGK